MEAMISEEENHYEAESLVVGVGDEVVYVTVIIVFSLIGYLVAPLLMYIRRTNFEPVAGNVDQTLELHKTFAVGSTSTSNVHEENNEVVTYDDDICPICHSSFINPIVTMCGHIFCFSCFRQLWQRSALLQPVNCPLCRSLVREMKPHNDLLADHDGDSASQIRLNIRAYNLLHREERQMTDFIECLNVFPILVPHIVRAFFSTEVQMAFRHNIAVCIIVYIIYLFSPVDLIPDTVPFGYLDDTAILFALLVYIVHAYRSLIERVRLG